MPQPGEDYYNDGGDQSSPPSATPEKSGGEDGDGAKTSILPRSFFPNEDLKVGDICSVEVKAIHENEVEVVYSDKEEGDEMKDKPDEQQSSSPPAAAGGDGGMASMME